MRFVDDMRATRGVFKGELRCRGTAGDDRCLVLVARGGGRVALVGICTGVFALIQAGLMAASVGVPRPPGAATG